ncbi:MMPL family transporter [Motilibacter sp. E257]|uniref:MMPL family transporter n=1 Tax=Motilibacter deserti TaxID=2714956 RepID=A0ABX0GZL2_9ACTN|nr:MMPL family transporter [Motilibacter deserti]
MTPGSDSSRGDARIESATGTSSDGGVLALVEVQPDVDAAPARAMVEDVADRLAADPAVVAVTSYYSTGDRAMVSRDGRMTYVVARLEPGAGDEETVHRLRDRLEGVPGVRLGGSPVVDEQVTSTVHEDLVRAELFALPLLFLLSLWVFRSLFAAALPVLAGGLNVALTLLVLHGVTAGMDLSLFALNLVTTLGMGLAIDYSLLMVSRYRSELAEHGRVDDAVRQMVRTAGRTILFSSVTVVAALAALLVFRQRFLYSMAIGGALVAAMSAVVALVVLPPLLRLLGHRLDLVAPARWRRPLERAETAEGGWFTVARHAVRRPVTVAVVGAALLLALGLPLLGVRFTFIDATALPPSASARAVDDALQERFESSPSDLVSAVVTDTGAGDGEQRAQQVATAARALPAAAAVTGPVALDTSTWLVQVQPREGPLTASSRELVEQLRELPDGPLLVTGSTARFVDLRSSIASNLPLALAIVCLTNVFVLALMTGSLVLPLKSVLMTLLTLSATYGALVLIFQDGHLGWLLGHDAQGALETTQPVLLFALVFGLSTDYGVFLLARIKEARDAGADEREAIVLGVGRTGRVVTAAALLLCVAMGALATSRIVFIKELGVGAAIGVLLDATIVRAFLVPSLMALLGRWNWWGPGFLQRAHRRFGYESLPPPPATAPPLAIPPPAQRAGDQPLDGVARPAAARRP